MGDLIVFQKTEFYKNIMKQPGKYLLYKYTYPLFIYLPFLGNSDTSENQID